MSTSLYWTPPPSEVIEHDLGYLKYEIGRYFDDEYNGSSETWAVDREIIPFLEGIYAVGNEFQKRDAQALICAIKKYGNVVLIIH